MLTSRPRRWLRRLLVTLLVLGTPIALALLLLARGLDAPWPKRGVQGLVRRLLGVEVDYRALRVRLLGGVTLRGLVVLSPPAVRSLAPELLRVGALELRWSPSSLLGGGPSLEAAAIADVRASVVVDERGRTSFDLLGGGPGGAGGPAPPLSQLPLGLLAQAGRLPEVTVERVALTVLRTAGGAVQERLSLEGLAVHLRVLRAEAGVSLHAALGAPARPLQLTLAHEPLQGPAAQARLRLWLGAELSAERLGATLDLGVREQSFVPHPVPEELLHAELQARFDPRGGKTLLRLDRARLAGDVATLEAALLLPDRGAPLLERASGDLWLDRLLLLVPRAWLPFAIRAERAHLRYAAAQLRLAPLPQGPGAALDVEAELAGLFLALPQGPLVLPAGRCSLALQPEEAGQLHAKGSLLLEGLSATTPAGPITGRAVGVELDAAWSREGLLTGAVALRFGALEQGGATTAALREGSVRLTAQGLSLDLLRPQEARGAVALSAALQSLELLRGGARGAAGGLALQASTRLTGGAPYGLEASFTTASSSLERGGQPLLQGPLRVGLRISEAHPDLLQPLASRLRARLGVGLAQATAALEVSKEPDGLAFALDARSPALGLLAPFLPPALRQELPLEQMDLSLRSRGTVARLGSALPLLRHQTDLQLGSPGYRSHRAASLALHASSRGTARQGEGELELSLAGLSVEGDPAADQRLSVHGSFDLDAPRLDVGLESSGRAEGRAKLGLAFDRKSGRVDAVLEGRLAQLGALARLLPQAHPLGRFDLSQLGLAWKARGSLAGVVTGLSAEGAPTFAPDPLRDAQANGAAELQATGFGWARGDLAVAAQALSLHLEAQQGEAGGRRALVLRLEAPALKLAQGEHDLSLAGVKGSLDLGLRGSLADPVADLTARLELLRLEQDALVGHAVGGVVLALAARRERDGTVLLSSLDLDDRVGGTRLSLTGTADLGGRYHHLSLRGGLEQDLSRLSTQPELLAGRGVAKVALRLESPDLELFRLFGDLHLSDVALQAPARGITVEGASGELPLSLTLRASADGVRLLREGRGNPYSSLRFVDQHPLLQRSSFLTVQRIRTPTLDVAPFVGNLEVEQNILSIRQFELGIRGGRVTGQGEVEWNRDRSIIDLHLRADGVRSSHGEPFSGSAALVISAKDRSIEGRAEVVQIGKRHLLDLLDLEDPAHVDEAINRVRRVLRFGYPERLRVDLDHGFASAHLTFGGLARFVSVGDLRGIPLGPLVDKLVEPLLEKSEATP